MISYEIFGVSIFVFSFTENDSIFQCPNTWFERRPLILVVQCMGHLEKSVVCWNESLYCCYHPICCFGKFASEFATFHCSTSLLQFVHCLLILLSLGVLCVVKPYKKYHINVMEMLVLLCLFGATVSILDEDDIYIGQKVSAAFISFPFLYGIIFILYRALWNIAVACWLVLS